jgi:hypothetical protein
MDETTLGAKLEELYKAGTVEIPNVAGAFRSASTQFGTIDFTEALRRHADLGTGETGCSSTLHALLAAVQGAAGACDTTMTSVAANLTTTAQELARADDDARADFLAAGGRL